MHRRVALRLIERIGERVAERGVDRVVLVGTREGEHAYAVVGLGTQRVGHGCELRAPTSNAQPASPSRVPTDGVTPVRWLSTAGLRLAFGPAGEHRLLNRLEPLHG